MPTIKDKLAKKKSKLASVKERLKDHPANLNNYEEGAFFRVPVNLIKPNPYQPRQEFNKEALNELSQSIKEKGVLQPIIIKQGKNNSLILVAGERRLRAAKKAGLEEIPAIFTQGNPAEIALIENLQRENLNPIEEAEAYERMTKEFNYTQEQLGHIVGKAKSTISEILSLNKLPPEIKKEVRTSELPKSYLVEVAKQKNIEDMKELIRIIKSDNLKTSHIRETTRSKKTKTTRTPASITIDKLQAFTKQLTKLDFNTISEKEKDTLTAELYALRRILDNLLG